MGPLPAIFIFLAASGLWAWIIFLDGAEKLEGSLLSGFLVDHRAPEWPAGAIRAFAILSWLGSLVWFILRLRAGSSFQW